MLRGGDPARGGLLDALRLVPRRPHRLPDRDRYQEIKEVVETQRDVTMEMATSSAASSAAPPAELSPPLDLHGVLEAMQSTPKPVSGDGLAGQTDCCT